MTRLYFAADLRNQKCVRGNRLHYLRESLGIAEESGQSYAM